MRTFLFSSSICLMLFTSPTLLAQEGISQAEIDRLMTLDFESFDQDMQGGWRVYADKGDFSAAADPRTGNLIITSAEDNLMKGAAGQAIQIMNVWQGFDETAGLL